MADAVIIVLMVIGAYRFAVATGRRGSMAGRYALWITTIAVFWLFVAVTHPEPAVHLASAAIRGAGTAMSGIDHFLSEVFQQGRAGA